MNATTTELVEQVTRHRLYTHPIWEHWAESPPPPDVVGALFHQIQCFCASTRPGGALPEGLRALGLGHQAELLEEIVASEAGHGPELATMAAHIINQAAGRSVFGDLYDQAVIEAGLKKASDRILGTLPAYDPITGLTVQARRAITVFERRKLTDPASVMRNLGTAHPGREAGARRQRPLQGLARCAGDALPQGTLGRVRGRASARGERGHRG